MSKNLVAFISASGTTKKVAEMIAEEAKTVEGFEFVWITDGQGWFSAKNKLEEAYNIIPSLYNLRLMDYVGDRQYGSGYLFSFWKTKLSDQQAIQLTTL